MWEHWGSLNSRWNFISNFTELRVHGKNADQWQWRQIRIFAVSRRPFVRANEGLSLGTSAMVPSHGVHYPGQRFGSRIQGSIESLLHTITWVSGPRGEGRGRGKERTWRKPASVQILDVALNGWETKDLETLFPEAIWNVLVAILDLRLRKSFDKRFRLFRSSGRRVAVLYYQFNRLLFLWELTLRLCASFHCLFVCLLQCSWFSRSRVWPTSWTVSVRPPQPSAPVPRKQQSVTPKFKMYILPSPSRSEVVRIASIIIFHLSKRWKAKFFILRDVYFGWGCRGNFKLITLGRGRVVTCHTMAQLPSKDS